MSTIIKSFCNFISSLYALKKLRSLVDFLLVNWYICCIFYLLLTLYSLLQENELMYASSLSSITAEYIKSITNTGVYSRGISYFRSGRVLNLKYRDGELTAAVSGSEPFPYEVSILADEEEIYEMNDMNCTCPYASDGGVCKHIVATLLQWIENRNKARSYKQPLPKQHMLFNPLPFEIPRFKDFDYSSPFSSLDYNPAYILNEIFSDFGNFT